jgi:CubicO group peptidase (beta-lactamase class C family)
MKATQLPFIILCVVVVAIAQESPRSQVPVEQRFKQWDKNGDGKLTPDEVPGEKLFKMLDKDGDGVVTLEEARAFGGGARRAADVHGTDPAAKVKLPPAENFKPRAHGDEAKAAGLKPEALAKIDVEMQRHVAAPDVAGIVALVSRHGKVGYYETFGMQDREAQKPMPKDAIFRLYSMTKPIVAAAAMILFDEGKFTLDEPISKHCPEWKDATVMEKGEKVPAKNPITPRMLMSHSSGLYYGMLRESREDVTLTKFSELLAQVPLKFHPGTSYQYGHSIDILGRYVEAVSGQPLDEFMRERIFKPLKMTDTDFWVPAEKKERIAQMYSQRPDGALERGRDSASLLEKPKCFLGGQGLVGTAGDYARFCQMLLNKGELGGARVLKKETVELMFQNHLKFPGQKYGLGAMTDGNGGYAWGGAAGTQFFVDSKNDYFVVYMVQTQRYRSPAYNDFKRLATEAAGIASGRGPDGGGLSGDGNDMTRQFKQRDKNADGKLDRDELPGALFERLDANKDGFVTEDELKSLWKAR